MTDPSSAPVLGPASLAGRVALVTGSSTGLGKAIAHALAAAGASVALNYANDLARAEAALAEFRDAGHQGMLVRASAVDEADVERMARAVEAELGPVDILVVNATPAQPQRPIEEYDWSFYQSMLDFFVKSPYLLARAHLPHMKSQRWGRIVNIGSEVFQRGTPEFSAYVAAKGGQNGWTRSMATELAPWNITVNIVAPGWIPVERHENDPQEAKDAYLAAIPMGRWGVPDDVAGTVAFLASDAASFVTGQNISGQRRHLRRLNRPHQQRKPCHERRPSTPPPPCPPRGGAPRRPPGGRLRRWRPAVRSDRVQVGYVTNGVASFWVIAGAGAEAAGRDLDVDVDVLMPAAGIADQKRMLEDLVTRGVDGIAVSPIDPANQTELLDTLARRTHLITHDSDAPEADRLYYVGMDNYDAGRLCGALVTEAIPDGGTVYLFIGRLEQDNARRRRQGVIDEILGRNVDPDRYDPPGAVLEGNGYTILGTLTDQFDRAKAKANAEDALSRHGDIDAMVGLFAYNPPLILEALKQAGKLGQTKVIAFDEADETLQGILDGTVHGTVVQNPWEYGYQSVEILTALARGNDEELPPSEFIDHSGRVRSGRPTRDSSGTISRPSSPTNEPLLPPPGTASRAVRPDRAAPLRLRCARCRQALSRRSGPVAGRSRSRHGRGARGGRRERCRQEHAHEDPGRCPHRRRRNHRGRRGGAAVPRRRTGAVGRNRADPSGALPLRSPRRRRQYLPRARVDALRRPRSPQKRGARTARARTSRARRPSRDAAGLAVDRPPADGGDRQGCGGGGQGADHGRAHLQPVARRRPSDCSPWFGSSPRAAPAWSTSPIGWARWKSSPTAHWYCATDEWRASSSGAESLTTVWSS